MPTESRYRQSFRLTAAIRMALAAASILGAQNRPADLELNTLLFHSTFKIEQQIDRIQLKVGTVFILGRPIPDAPQRARYVLVTAKHVLAEMPHDEARLILRQRSPDSTWKRLIHRLRIKENGRPLWTSHPTADVAAMYISVPPDTGIQLLPEALLADGKTLEHYQIHPGDELNCLGYPFGHEANVVGFPILRSGKIASYPLYPAKDHPTFLYDFEVFGGNSGGPVYMADSAPRYYAGSTHIGRIQFIAGLVSRQGSFGKERLALAEVVQSSFIRETIDLLPVPNESRK